MVLQSNLKCFALGLNHAGLKISQPPPGNHLSLGKNLQWLDGEWLLARWNWLQKGWCTKRVASRIPRSPTHMLISAVWKMGCTLRAVSFKVKAETCWLQSSPNISLEGKCSPLLVYVALFTVSHFFCWNLFGCSLQVFADKSASSLETTPDTPLQPVLR